MAGKDWNNLGSDLNRVIEDAVNMKDFRRLNDSIRRVFDQTFCGMENKNGSMAGGSWDFNLSGSDKKQETSGGNTEQGAFWNNPGQNNTQQGGFRNDSRRTQQSSQQNTQGRAGNTYQQNRQTGFGTGGFQGSQQNTQGRRKARPQQSMYRSGAAGGTWSTLPYFAGNGRKYGAAAGYMTGGIFLSLFMSLLSLGIIITPGFNAAGLVASLIFLAAGIVMIVRGGKLISLAGRFNRYIRILNGRQYADIKSLAQYSNFSETAVLADLKKMIKRQLFLQGHLDEQETCFMVTNDAYAQYLETMKHHKTQQSQTDTFNKKNASHKDRLTPEAEAILSEGREYIRKIRKSNDAIPGEEISAKIYRLEMLVARIFQQAEAHPENISDLRRLMEYYLPTTMKLLDAYEELDGQPVQGENITASKKEIENTLDTLNLAFEKLLDNLFQDRAWDVSADISVLEAMLAQEGLTKDDFGKSQQMTS